jgi:hemoglobin-like flavoprotein
METSHTTDAGSTGITPAQVALVQSSFEHVLPIADVAGMLFYERIFTLAPEARALFGDDIALQASRTMAAVKTAVDGLGDIDHVAPFLTRLGARHVRYGVQPHHYRAVGQALIRALAAHLDEGWDEDLEAAWRRAFNLVAELMMEAAEDDR